MTASDDRPDLDRAKAIFEQALAVAEAGRETFVRDQCGSDSELAEMVLKLLGEHQQVQPTVEPPVSAGHKHDTESLGEGPGDKIGPYVLISKIGEGGMGIVYRAQRTEPVKLTVALKVIKAGMDTREVIARFEVERQALALMNHPHVARVLDAGATKTGRPYFVMEYVPGVSVTEYCNRHRLTTRQRLELFLEACDAVQHAHQKGVIHRDIKPSNLLVSVKEGSPQLKVIDFGVAKAVSQRLTEKTLFTEQGQLIGTPEYMSPEQAEMGSLDIDTRTDVYSLGVLLYELLSGALPFDPSKLREAGFAEIQRIIREQEPAKPSTRLSGLGAESTDVARQHGSEPRTLLREIRGDLDWITMKALEKDRTRRYDTASGLAMDIHRYLLDEPVLARPPSGLYRARKFIRRHKVGVIAGTALALTLVVSVIGIGLSLSRARAAAANAHFRLQAARREAMDAQLQIDALAPLAQQAHDLAYLMPPELREDFPSETRNVNEWIGELFPAPIPTDDQTQDEVLQERGYYRVFGYGGHSAGRPKTELYEWVKSKPDQIQKLIDATRQYRFKGSRVPESATDQLLVDQQLKMVWRRLFSASVILVANAEARHEDGDWEEAIESLRAARRVARAFDGAFDAFAFKGYEMRSNIFETYRWMVVDAAANGRWPPGYRRFIAQDPPIARIDLALAAQARAVRQIVNESFVQDDPSAVPKLDVNRVESASWFNRFGRGTGLLEEKRSALRDVNYESTIELIDEYFNYLGARQDATFKEKAELMRGEREVRQNALLNLILRHAFLFMPDVEGRRRLEMERDASLIVAAICGYRCMRGVWPESLDGALATADAQPLRREYYGSEFIYRMEKEWPLLYCVGSNGKDDGGSEDDVRFTRAERTNLAAEHEVVASDRPGPTSSE